MDALHKTALRLLWPSLVAGLATLLGAVALLLLGYVVPALAVGAVCGLCAVPALIADPEPWPGKQPGRPTTR